MRHLLFLAALAAMTTPSGPTSALPSEHLGGDPYARNAAEGVQAIADWFGCLERQAARMAASREPAATVADAAIGACMDQQRAVANAYRAAGLDPAAPLAQAIEDQRRRLLAMVIAARSE